VSKQAVDWAEALPTLPTGVKPLLVHLARFARKDTHTCYRPQDLIAESIDQSLSTVKRNVKWLREAGLISTKPSYKEGVRVADEITLIVGATLSVNLTCSQVSNRPVKIATLGVKNDELRCQKQGDQVSNTATPSIYKLTNQQNKHCGGAIASTDLQEKNNFLQQENDDLKAQIEALKNQLAEQQKPQVVAVVEQPKPVKGKTEQQQVNADTWQAYANAYFKRYQVEPLRNAKTNTIISNFVKAVGADLAPVLARYYINLNTPHYLQKTHAIGLLLTDVEPIRTQYLSGRQITRQDVQRVERMQTAQNAIDELCAQSPNGEPW